MRRNLSLALAALMAATVVFGVGMAGWAWAQDDEGPMSGLRCATPTESQ